MRLTGIIYLSMLTASHEGCASIILVDFDHVARAAYNTPSKNIGGLVWTNFGVIAASYQTGPKGLNEGVVSTPNVAFNLNPCLTSSILGQSFGFIDAWFSSWSDDDLAISMFGSDRFGHVRYASTFTADTLGPVIHYFGWDNIASITLTAQSALGQSRFSMDDVRLSVPVPEPELAILIGVAFFYGSRARFGNRGLPL